MIKAVGVQFPTGIKAYDFDPDGEKVELSDLVLVETVQGREIGKVVYVGKEVKNKDLEEPLKKVEKVLDDRDKERLERARENRDEDLDKFTKCIERLGLAMTPLIVDYNVIEDRVDLYFASDGRVDFRNAVRELSRIFRKSVRLKQVGTRDQAKVLGGFGPCGREVCCCKILHNAGGGSRGKTDVATPKNVGKVTGLCGNIMCCMSYEDETIKARGTKK